MMNHVVDTINEQVCNDFKKLQNEKTKKGSRENADDLKMM